MQNVPKIVLKRLQETAAAGAHPDADILTAFAEQSLVESERTRVIEHLARCSDCREVVALALPAAEDVAVTASTSPTRISWLSWPVLRWSVAVAGIIAITSIGIVQYRQRQKDDTLVSSLTQPNGTTATAQQPLPPSPPASALQGIPTQTEKESQALTQEKAPPSHADNSAPQRLVRPANPTLPAARAMQGAPSRSATASRSGSAGGLAPKAALSSPRSALAVAGGSRSAMPSATARLAPSPSARKEVEAPSSSQTVQVEPEDATVTATARDQVSDQLVEKQKELPSQDDSSKSLSVLDAKDLAAAQGASGAQHGSPRWGISADGALQRSFDAGKTWVDVNVNSGLVSGASNMAVTAESTRGQENRKKKVEVQPSPVFRAVSAVGADVWAGGSAAMLYHSADSGAHWARVLPSSSGTMLTGDITSIAFSDPQHGRIATSAGEVWITADDGQTWHGQ